MQKSFRRRDLLKAATAVSMAALFPSSASAHADKPKQSGTSASPSAPKVSLNVHDFGAKGDGNTNDTAAFQTALDRCAAVGGGEVLVPAGDYLIGSIQLRSNTTLRLDSAAILRGTPNFDDYAVTTVRWEGSGFPDTWR